MCGIHEIIQHTSGDQRQLKQDVGRMIKRAKHRGPDQQNVLVLGDKVGIGMNRLSIVSPNEVSTIQTSDKGNYAVFNGEIVNHRELRSSLSRPLSSSSDSAVILPAIEEKGEHAVEEFAGMFAIAVYDPLRQRGQVWRDPLGIKPLYYYHDKDRTIVSSEVKSIYAVAPNEPWVDFSAVDHILRYRFQPGRSTVFPDIKRVLPGETIVFDKDQEDHRKYWELSYNRRHETSGDGPIEDFRKLLTKVVKEQASADVPGGFFVSGGLDSSLITAVALREAGDSPYKQPISLKFSPNPVVDERYAGILEKSLNTRFEWVEISDKIARQTLMEVVPFLDEPLENPIHVGTYLMAKRAREMGIKTVLTGDGSDEFFLGYERHACWFKKPNPRDVYPSLHWTMRPDEAAELYTSEAKESVKPMVSGSGKQIEPFVDIDQSLIFERQERLPEYHNMRLDRMTMANGVEARVPFLDHRIVDYSLNIPLKKLFGKNGKGWLQEVASAWLPTEILERPKILFPSLPDQWLSGEGADWAAEILLDRNSESRKWFRTNVVERYIKEHKDQTRLRGKLLWAMTSLELWLKNQSEWRMSRSEDLDSKIG